MKENLLYLVHRIPFPPNKGDKIRSFNWLKGLSKEFNIYLGTYIDSPEDEQYLDELKKYCAEVFVLKLNPMIAKIKSLQGIIFGQALSLPYYANNEMQSWVTKCVQRNNIKKALVFSSPMAQFVEGDLFQHMLRIMDFVDIDSDKWKQYAEAKSGLMRWLYTREAKTLFEYERKLSQLFDSSLFVSSKEAEMFRSLVKQPGVIIDYVNNGVDFDYFSSEHDFNNPYTKEESVLVFTGAMDYWANVDAVVWFASEIFPQLKSHYKNTKFYIVGSKPTTDVLKLEEIDGVIVTGRVEDVRPYIHYASVVIAPMRIARGIQNKVLEGMAMAKPCIVSDQGLEGIAAVPGEDLLVANSSQEWMSQLSNIIENMSKAEIGSNARAFVVKKFSWENNVNRLIDFLKANKNE